MPTSSDQGEAPWAVLAPADRRFSLAEVIDACRSLPPPQLRAVWTGELAQVRRAATLVLATEIDGEASVLLTKRASTMSTHRGDWVFPGGRVHDAEGEPSIEAARRETEEEVGIGRERIDVVGQLFSHGPIITGFVIDVFIGVTESLADLRPDPREVDEVLVLPLSRFMAPAAFHRGGVPDQYRPEPSLVGAGFVTSAGGPPGVGAAVSPFLERFRVRGDEELWGTQGAILYELLAHLSATRVSG